MPTRRLLPALLCFTCAAGASPAGGCYIRFRLLEPAEARWYVRLGGCIHKPPWHLPTAVRPAGADKNTAARLAAGAYTPWLDVAAYAGKRFHGRMKRAGGTAEFPNLTVDFITSPPADRRRVAAEIATAPDPGAVVKRFAESYAGSKTSFLVSPTPERDAADLETAGEMTARRLRWAREATGGKRVSPADHLVQTSFWSPQRPELNLREAEVLWLLGFNVVGNQRPEVRERFDFTVPGHTHRVMLGPAATRPRIRALFAKHAAKMKRGFAKGAPFNFADEVVCRPRIGDNPAARAHFHAWLNERGIDPETLGVAAIGDTVPLETPGAFRARANDPAARRIFYYTSRFRQHALTERLRWHTAAFHEHFGPGPATSTLVADHPYFGGTGLGMGMVPNTTWGGAPLAADWFALARTRAVDMIGIEDWMGLQYMYGPDSTWEGFQLMGFQAAIFRSGSRGTLPIMAWITPSDETNLRLKTASALCQGAKHFFYWTYGPTPTSTENYWSDLRGAYDGVAAVTRQLAAAEHILAPGRPRKTGVGLLYSISSDLWQPFNYVHMLERRLTWFSLVHEQYLVDLLTEEDVAAGRLDDYRVLYTADPCIADAAAEKIRRWVRKGGHLCGSCAAGSRNAFGEPVPGLADVFGIAPDIRTATQKGRYRFRGGLNPMTYADRVRFDGDAFAPFGAIGTTVAFAPAGAAVAARFAGGGPAVAEHRFGEGRARYSGACPAVAYAKEAKFVPAALKEKWPATLRAFINDAARRSGATKPVALSVPVVEAGVFDADAGTALVLANFTYEPIKQMTVTLYLPRPCASVRSVEKGTLRFTAGKDTGRTYCPHTATFALDLGLTDIVLAEQGPERSEAYSGRKEARD